MPGAGRSDGEGGPLGAAQCRVSSATTTLIPVVISTTSYYVDSIIIQVYQMKRKAEVNSPVSSAGQGVAKQPRNEDKELKREWSTPTRVRVKTLFAMGTTRNDIFKQTNVSPSTQRTIIKSSDCRPGAKRPGAARKIDQRTVSQIIRYLSKSSENRQSTWKQLAIDFTEGVTARTVQNTLEEAGYHKCKACSWILAPSHTADSTSHHTSNIWQSCGCT